MRHLKIVTVTMTATATAVVVTKVARIGRPLLSLAERQRRELEGKPPMEVL